MLPIKFPEQNVVFAEDQEEYLSLPAYKENSPHGLVVTCWKLSFVERLRLICGGYIYLSLLTFNQPLQPIKIGTTFEEVQ